MGSFPNFVACSVLYLFFFLFLRSFYRLYDLNAIVSAIGGSLGLFLGISCIDVISVVGGWIRDAVKFSRKP